MIKRIFSSIIKGFPLINSVKDAIVKPKQEDLDKENKVNLSWIIHFLIQAGSVYGLIYLMNRYGLTLQDIKDLFGLLK